MFLQTSGKPQIIVFHSLCPLHSHSSFLFAFFHPRRNERHFRKLSGLLWITSEPLVTPPLLPSLLQAPTSHPVSHPAPPVPHPRGPCREVLRWEAASAFPRPFPDLLCSSAQRFLPYRSPSCKTGSRFSVAEPCGGRWRWMDVGGASSPHTLHLPSLHNLRL